MKQLTAVSPAPARLASIDAYRGFVMLLMMAEVFFFEGVSRALPGNRFWSLLAFGQTHVAWTGCSLHDLIQPSFSFLVGVALPFSIAGRQSRGIPFNKLLRSAIVRSLILMALGIFLRSMDSRMTNFTFEDTLTQIGLGYTFLFLLGFASKRTQLITLIVILVAYWAAFALYPLPGPGFDYSKTGEAADWAHNFHGFAAHWNKNTNFAWAFDRWFLNLFPRPERFEYNGGGYSTLSFIPTLGTMILGLMAGNTLRDHTLRQQKAKKFVITGIILMVLAGFFHFTGICPVVKRIWTPSWTLYSGGWCFLLLSAFYYVIDIKNHRSWAFFLMVIGMNSIAAYVLADGFGGFIRQTLYIHLGQHYDEAFGSAYASLVEGVAVLGIQWYILYRLYKKKIFIKI